MDRALDIADGGAVILSTDADAVPNSNWVEANLYEVERGADLVGGYIVGDPVEEELLGPGFIRRASRHLRHLKLVDCLRAIVDPVSHDPWPRHNDHTGASLAVKSDVYGRIGGIPEIACHEDIAFVAKACGAAFGCATAVGARCRKINKFLVGPHQGLKHVEQTQGLSQLG
jgi:GT2 family glycosyltransferase